MVAQRMLTEKDVDYLEQRLRDVFATKDEFTKYRSELINKLDKILQEIVASRQEQEIISRHSSDYEERISLLEKIHPQSQHPS
ncbi:hypothetical protein ISS85_04520 [Candidatus Microgenomates bacterium]|nr:hypothetical protein [Candidatus Microgenomates bacterium]